MLNLSDIWLSLRLRGSHLDKMGVDGDALGAVVIFVNTDKPVRKLKHVGPNNLQSLIFNRKQRSNLPERDDDELSVPGPLLDVVGHNRDVLELEGRVNLVHDVEGRGLVVMEREHQGEGGQGLLTSGKVGNVLPGLLGRSDTEHDALSEKVKAVHQLELGVATKSNHLIHLLQLPSDNSEAEVTDIVKMNGC